MMKKMSLMLSVFLLAVVAQASMVLNLDGKLKAFDEKTISIEDANFVYTIKKSALSAGQQTYFKSLKTGAAVKITVEREGIARVEDRKK